MNLRHLRPERCGRRDLAGSGEMPPISWRIPGVTKPGAFPIWSLVERPQRRLLS
jgi:hypothetical protein